MDKYFDITDFDKKIASAFKNFCHINQLALYASDASIYLEDELNPHAFLQKMNKVEYAVLTHDSITQSNSAWSHLRIPLQYESSLFKNIYEQFKNQEEKSLIYKYLTNFISPSAIAQYLKQESLEQLELFLISKKSKNSKYWLEDNILEYVTPLMSGRESKEKSKLLELILANNIYVKDLAHKNKLFKFLNIHISSEYREKFIHYCEEIKNVKENTLFQYPDNTLIIDLNKVALAGCFSVDFKVTDTYINSFFNNFQYVLCRKESKKILNVKSCEISQKSQAYKNYRITLSPEENKCLDKFMIESYIKSFIDIYTNKNCNDKKLLNEINKKIVLNLVLSDKLPEKSVSFSRKKI